MTPAEKKCYEVKKLIRACRRDAGLCVSCPNNRKPNQVVAGRTRCRKCLNYFKKAQKRFVEKRQKAGLCPTCGSINDRMAWSCSRCGKRHCIIAKRLRTGRMVNDYK